MKKNYNKVFAASNGYVSTYIYDGEGKRTVKLSAPYEAVYTNSADATVPSDTLRYTLYVGPHYTVTGKSGSEDEEPLYVKHFFIGDKRIASKIGNPPGNDPRGITGVAGKTLHIKVDYPVKYSEQKEQVSANYTNFAMPYSNIDMNNYDYPFNRPGYWNGCVPPNENGTVIVRSANARNGEDANDEEDVSSLRNSPSESSLFFYHTDHLGSTNLVTDRGRSICHAAEYLPYGEVFLEIKGSYDHLGTPFKFNGKEMDPETGMLYYGARYYMPKYCQWPTCDPMQLKYPHVSSYAFCKNNPINRIDDDGKDDYILNSRGYIAVLNETSDRFDRLILRGTKKQLIVNDRKILGQLAKTVNKKNISCGILSNRSEATKLFKFLSDNTGVEWGLDSYHTSKGDRHVLRTSHSEGDVSTVNDKYRATSMYYSIHSHPGPGNEKASGPYKYLNNGSRTIQLTAKQGGDWMVLNDIYNAFIDAGSNNVPKFYIYHPLTGKKIEYNNISPSVKTYKVNSYKDLLW